MLFSKQIDSLKALLSQDFVVNMNAYIANSKLNAFLFTEPLTLNHVLTQVTVVIVISTFIALILATIFARIPGINKVLFFGWFSEKIVKKFFALVGIIAIILALLQKYLLGFESNAIFVAMVGYTLFMAFLVATFQVHRKIDSTINFSLIYLLFSIIFAALMLFFTYSKAKSIDSDDLNDTVMQKLETSAPTTESNSIQKSSDDGAIAKEIELATEQAIGKKEKNRDMNIGSLPVSSNQEKNKTVEPTTNKPAQITKLEPPKPVISKKEFEELQSKVDNLKEKLTEKDELVDTLKNSIDRLRMRMDKLNTTQKKIKDVVINKNKKKLLKKIDNMTEQLGNLKKELNNNKYDDKDTSELEDEGKM